MLRTAGRWAGAAAVIVALVAPLVVIDPDPAGACSCFPTFDIARVLPEEEAAFVGRLVGRRKAPPELQVMPDGSRYPRFLYRYRVDEVVKGSFPAEVEILSGEGGGDCGLDTPVGEPVGLLVGHWRGWLASDLCSQVEPERMRRAIEPVPPPDGRPPAWLLVGTTYGGGRVLSLDGHGRVVAFGAGQGETTLMDVCPGSERMVEVFHPSEPSPPIPVLAVRRIDGLAVEREVALPDLGPSGGVWRQVEAVSCRDGAAGDVALFVREGAPRYRSRVVQLQGKALRTVWEGTATHGAFHPGGHLASLTGGRDGTELRVLDLTTRPADERQVATLPEEPEALVVGPKGMVVAVTADSPRSPRLVVTVELATGKVRTVAVPGESPSGRLVWAPHRRLLFVPNFPGHPLRVYDRNLGQIAAWRGWEGEHHLVAGGRLVGLAQGTVRTATIEDGATTLLAELGDGVPGAMVAVPEPGGAPAFSGRPGRESKRSSGWTIAAMAAVLAAGAVAAAAAIGRPR